ncbi:hypothetical protein [Sulfurospirillum sp. 1612]|uniref:hypothetical protein n=1 Tax=Sulfurospirillum sp. 1612 TaxID=3094835 RepID=UPI002F940786
MNANKRTKLKTSDLFGNFSYPEQSWSLPSWVAKNEMFLEILKDVIACRVTEECYVEPTSFPELFSYLSGRNYAVFEERFVVCLSQGRLSYLTSAGFTKVSATPDLFELSNWKMYR